MIHIAIMGFGTVGGGVAEVLSRNGMQIAQKVGEEVAVKTILVRHFKDGPYRHLMTDKFEEIETDPDIQVVVETIGGNEAAYDYTRRALAAGKHVITANKQLVAEKGAELLALAKEKNVNYLFEASVGGGIPILRPLSQCMAANQIEEVYGILNGTTNYILTRMVRTGAFFTDALREAQAKGYAEADPTADIEGIDAGRKTCILADLAFGQQVLPESVPMEGISRLSLRDVKVAERAGYRIKLLGRAIRLSDGSRTAYVAPHLIPEDAPIATVEDVFNAIVVKGNATGEVMFYGRGAGALPTASAVVADVIDALQHRDKRKDIGWSASSTGFAGPETLPMRFYYRIDGSLTDAALAFGQVEVLSEDGETAFLTEPIPGIEAASRERTLNVLSKFRVLDT